MTLNKEELDLFLTVIAEKAIKAGIEESIVRNIVAAGIRHGENKDALDTGVVIVKEAIKGHVPKGIITTIVAEAFVETKKEIEKQRKSQKNKPIKKETTPEVIEEHVVMPQVLYGPPPMMKREGVVVEKVEMPQVLYGPPPMMKREEVVVEKVEIPQVLYGPPPIMKREEVTVSSMFEEKQPLYGPPPAMTERKPKK